MENQLTAAITRGLEYLGVQQEQDGSFISYLSLDPDIARDITPIKTVFIPALMLNSLSYIDNPKCFDIRQKIATFLLSQKGTQWTFNFLARDEPQHSTRNYPDDLDDTFCVYIALHAHDPTLITTETLADMTKVLLATETSVGGPYRTWLVPPNSEKIWLDVDIAINSNIAYFLSIVSQPPDGLKQYIEQAIATDQLSSPYYTPIYPIVYYLTRSYTGPQKQKLRRLVEQASNQSSLSALDRALLISSLIRLTTSKDACTEYVKVLLDLQNPDGSWPARAFCTDENTKAGLYFNGSSTLATAFALEALALYRQLTTQPTQHIRHPNPNKPPIAHGICAGIRDDCDKLQQPLKNILLDSLSKLIESKNSKEITQLSTNFNRSLKAPLTNHKQFLARLNKANLYGWIAYTIYDDFMDDEGDPTLLSAANVAMRLSHETFLRALPDKAFQDFVRDTFNTMDNANSWELTHCRFNTYKKSTITITQLPNYDGLMQLANRSIGHTLGPLALLVKSGSALKSADFQAVNTALKHYIIAKQLNDDAHDWQEDFLRGHITYVVATILEELAVSQGTYKFHELLPIMQRHFWHYSLTTICNEMEKQLTLSRNALATTAVLRQENVITYLLDKVDASVEDTLSKQTQTREFLQYF